MKRTLLPAFFVLAGLVLAAAGRGVFAESGMLPTDFFKNLRLKYLDNLPDSFTAELTGRSISTKLSTIPKENITPGSNAYVEISYSKAAGFSIEVKNVASYYVDMYRDYARFLNVGMSLSNQVSSNFLSKYDFTFTGGSSSGLKLLKMQVRNAEDANILYVDTATSRVNRIDTVKGSELVLSTIITYSEYSVNGKTYSIINRFLVKRFAKGQDSIAESFELVKVKIK